MATTQQQVQHVIDEHLNEFELPGVLSVRAGFRMRDGWITGEIVNINGGQYFA